MNRTIPFILLGCCAWAQEVHVEKFHMRAPAPEGVAGTHEAAFLFEPGPVMGATLQFMSHDMSVGGRTVKGSPYSAQGVTETTQVLADGNRISRKTSSAIYRDSEGRTRREQTLPAIGPWASKGPNALIFLNDPVSNTHFILHPDDRTARKATSRARTAASAPEEAAADHIIIRKSAAAATAGVRVQPNVKTESLGKRNIEGVVAEGTRSTFSIAAGEIGNERAIDVVSETWYSPELKAVVMSRQSDPRMGETVYRLTSISRGEQPRLLFEVPSDYKIIEDAANFIRKIETR